MTTFDPAAAAIWKDLDSGAAYNPEKNLIRDWAAKVEVGVTALEAAVTALQSVGTDGYVLRESVVAATTGNVALTGAYSVDGVTVTNGQRYLAWQQTDPAENGVYIYNSAGAHARATDMDAAGEVQGSAFAATGGETYEGWILKTESEVTTLGTDDIDFYAAVDLGSILTAVNTHAANETDPHGFTSAGMAVGKAADAAAQRTALGLSDVAASGDSDDLTEGEDNLLLTSGERAKLAAIEAGATADQSGAEIKAAYEAQDDTNAFTDAEKAKLAGVASAATKAEQIDRPGDNPEAFSASYSGEGSEKAALSGGTVVDDAGLSFVQSGAGAIARRHPVALANDVIEFLARVRRTSNPSDPNNHAILLRVAWLDENKELIGSVETLDTEAGALTSSGLVELSARVSALAVEDVTAPPSGAIYACPFIQTYGEDGVTAIETLRSREVTDLHEIESADLSTLITETEAARDAANAAADLVATETLDTMADVASYDRADGVGSITLKGGYARGDGLGGQWVYDPDGIEVTADVPELLIGNDGANYVMATANLVYRSKADIATLTSATDIAVGQTVTVTSGNNGESEDFTIYPAGTYTANGTTVITLTGISGQAVSHRMKFNTYAEWIADTRPDAWFTAGEYIGVGGPSGWTAKKVSSGETRTTTGDAKFQVMPGVLGVTPMAFGGAIGGTASTNTTALQAAIDTGYDVRIEGVGEYETDGPVYLPHTGSYYRMDTTRRVTCSPSVILTRSDTDPSNFVNRAATGYSVAAGAGVTTREGAWYKNDTASPIVMTGDTSTDAVSDGLTEALSDVYDEGVIVVYGSNYLFDGLQFQDCKRTIIEGQDPDEVGTENSHTSFNRYRNIGAKNCSVGFTSRSSAGRYYSSHRDIHVAQCQIGFDIGGHSGSIGVGDNNNRCTYDNLRAARCHVGYAIWSGSTNIFMACHTEGCGAAPTSNAYDPPENLPEGEDTWCWINQGLKNMFIACVDEGGEMVIYNDDAEAIMLATWWREGSSSEDTAFFAENPLLMLNSTTTWLNGGILSNFANTKADVFGGRSAQRLLKGTWRRSGNFEMFDENNPETGTNERVFDVGAMASGGTADITIWGDSSANVGNGTDAAAVFTVDVIGNSQTNSLLHHTTFRVLALRNGSRTLTRYHVLDTTGGRATGANAGDSAEAFTPTLSVSSKDLVLTLTAPARTFERVTAVVRGTYNRE